MVSSGICDVVIASAVHYPSEEVDENYIIIVIIPIIMNKSQETTISGGRQKLTSAMKLRPEK